MEGMFVLGPGLAGVADFRLLGLVLGVGMLMMATVVIWDVCSLVSVKVICFQIKAGTTGIKKKE